MDYKTINRLSFFDPELTHRLCYELKIPELKEPKDPPHVAFEELKSKIIDLNMNNLDDTDALIRASNEANTLNEIIFVLDESFSNISLPKSFRSNLLIRALPLANTFRKKVAVFDKSDTVPEIQKLIISDLKSIGTIEDWVFTYLHHNNKFSKIFYVAYETIIEIIKKDM